MPGRGGAGDNSLNRKTGRVCLLFLPHLPAACLAPALLHLPPPTESIVAPSIPALHLCHSGEMTARSYTYRYWFPQLQHPLSAQSYLFRTAPG